MVNPVYFTSGAYLLAVFLCLFAMLRRGKYEALVTGLERRLSNLSAKPLATFFSLFFGVILLRIALLPVLPVPTPEKHDEFSYLLLGDTLAHLRLTNPAHPLWKSFETFHELFSPTYCSKYPPAQGFFLAIGQWLGNPWFGVVLSAAAMVALFYWALRVWIPARWAFLAAFLAGVKLCFTSYWMNSFWGGAPAAIGGAITLGSLARIYRRPAAGPAITLGLGISILANSRPYEGAAFCVPIAIALLWWLAGKTKRPETVPERFRKVILPLAAVLLANFVFMGYYNWRLTGNPRTMPLAVYEARYNPGAIFLWQSPKPPIPQNNHEFDVFYNGWVRSLYKPSWDDIKTVTLKKEKSFVLIFLWWDLILLVPAAFHLLKRKKIRLLYAAFLFTVAAFFFLAWVFPHYIAPALCVVFAIIVTCMRHLRLFHWRGLNMGLFLSRMLVLGLLLQTANAVVTVNEDPAGVGGVRLEDRVALIKKLQTLPGKHLVIVQYAPDHNVHDEWVYNAADPDSSKIVWARDLDRGQNQKLLDYYKDRTVWTIDADRMSSPPRRYSLPVN
ncbi:MAG: hypothetical protein JSS69_05825 [Acidobacteria bacterium]|nr:hypothetical protein [Acidobacteriota bacterium]MBS1865420.1 hypothetical protein [Acidobacteriota bacterium]